MTLLDKEAVKRVKGILRDFDPSKKVIVLDTSARTADDAAASLGVMGAALAAFDAGKGIDALASLGAGAAAFLFGDKSPVALSIRAGENADTIKEGADAMNTFADAYANLAELSDSEVDFNLKKLIKDIKKLNEAFTVSVKMDGADLEQLSVDIAAAIQTAQLTAANQQASFTDSSSTSVVGDSNQVIITAPAGNNRKNIANNKNFHE